MLVSYVLHEKKYDLFLEKIDFLVEHKFREFSKKWIFSEIFSEFFDILAAFS